MVDVRSQPQVARWNLARGVLTTVLTNLLLAVLVTVVGPVGRVEFVAVLAVSVLVGLRAARPDPTRVR